MSFFSWVLVAKFMFSEAEHEVAIDNHNIIQQPFSIKDRAFNFEIPANFMDADLVGFEVSHRAVAFSRKRRSMPNVRRQRARAAPWWEAPNPIRALRCNNC